MSRVNPENLKYPKLISRVRPSGKKYYYFNSTIEDTKVRKEIALGCNQRAAIEQYKKLYALENGNEFIKVPDGYEKVLLRNLLKNAKSRGIEVGLTEVEIKSLLERCNGKCSITGIKFNMHHQSYKMRPWIPSIDRIDSNKGYFLDNVRIICAYANLAINQYGIETLMFLSSRITRNTKT
jgi:hypothetical protein